MEYSNSIALLINIELSEMLENIGIPIDKLVVYLSAIHQYIEKRIKIECPQKYNSVLDAHIAVWTCEHNYEKSNIANILKCIVDILNNIRLIGNEYSKVDITVILKMHLGLAIGKVIYDNKRMFGDAIIKAGRNAKMANVNKVGIDFELLNKYELLEPKNKNIQRREDGGQIIIMDVKEIERITMVNEKHT